MQIYNGLRVLYVGSPPLFEKGASSIHMMKMCQAMSNLGIQVELVLPGNFSKKRLFDYYSVKPNFEVKTIRFTDKFARQILHGIFSSFYARSNRKKYDFVMTRNIVFAYIATVYVGIPTIYDAHHPPVNKSAVAMLKTFIQSKYFMGMSFNSNGLLKLYSKAGIVPQNSVVAHNGVEIEKFDVGADKNELRKNLNIPRNSIIVTYSGNTYEGRGIEYIIQVARYMKDVEFLIVGGSEKDNHVYKLFVKQIGITNIKFTGFVDHKKVADYLLASDILLMPYTRNVTIKGGTDAYQFTSPIKLFEYMAAERPIIASSIPSVMEILKDGMNSVIIEPGNGEELAKTIRGLIKDKNIALFIAKNARREVSKYTWEKRVEKIISGLKITEKLNIKH
ncbi:MAG: glycosyltransferase family 4 protein [Thermodesulfobacteriota bacterium]